MASYLCPERCSVLTEGEEVTLSVCSTVPSFPPSGDGSTGPAFTAEHLEAHTVNSFFFPELIPHNFHNHFQAE